MRVFADQNNALKIVGIPKSRLLRLTLNKNGRCATRQTVIPLCVLRILKTTTSRNRTTMKPHSQLNLAAFAVFVLSATVSQAEVIGGIDFPMGAASFADTVLTYTPLFAGGPGPTEPNSISPSSAIGVPDYPAGGVAGDPGAVSLGNGGLIELRFVDNLLTNSASSARDLHVFEVGPEVEDTFVAVRPLPETALLLGNPSLFDTNSDGFYEIGKVSGATSSIDIDLFFPGFAAGALRFDAVQLVDDRFADATTGPTVGADIDAVGAISSVPEPSTFGLLVLGISITLFRRLQTKLPNARPRS